MPEPTSAAKTVFVSISFAHREARRAELDAIEAACAAAGLRAHIFVRAYTFAPDDQRAMMDRTQSDLRVAGLLIAEVSHKAIGVGIEIGFAKALGIPVIYLRHETAAPSTTVGGIADHALVYANADDLRARLAEVLVNK